MKQLLLILPLWIVLAECAGQNLVPNPSFEDTTYCPSNLGQIDAAKYWFNPNAKTPDYYNACSSGWTGVPDNLNGHQHARTGTAYAGINCGGPSLTPANGREYIEVPLTDTLTGGRTYTVQFYASLSDYCSMAISSIGCSVTASPLTSSGSTNFTVSPQIENAQGRYITDTSRWISISGTFIAAGGEKYLTIGNFRNDAMTDSVMLDQNGYDYAYYFIDDVSVTADANTDTTVATYTYNIFPSPTSGHFFVSGNFPNKSELHIYDMLGREVSASTDLSEGNTIISVWSDLAEGVYTCRITSNGTVLYTKKIILIP